MGIAEPKTHRRSLLLMLLAVVMFLSVISVPREVKAASGSLSWKEISIEANRKSDAAIKKQLYGYCKDKNVDFYMVTLKNCERKRADLIIRQLEYDNTLGWKMPKTVITKGSDVQVNFYTPDSRSMLSKVAKQKVILKKQMKTAGVPLKGVKSKQTEKQKAVKINTYIAKRMKYQRSSSDVITAISKGRGNCEAFADYYIAMCSLAGIKCDKVVGTENGVSHAWCRVCVSGKWYYSDPCMYCTKGRAKAYLLSKTLWKKYVIKG